MAVACMSCHTPVASGARVLAVQTVAGKSHWNFMRAVLGALTDRGHQVTVFTPFTDGDRENYTEVDLSAETPIKVGMSLTDIQAFFITPATAFSVIMNMTRHYCEIIYNSNRMKEILSKGQNSDYDLIVTEPMCSSCVDYLAATLKLPQVYVVPSPMITFMERKFYGHVPNPAVSSHLFALYAWPKSFRQRLDNVILYVNSLYILSKSESLAIKTNPQPFDNVGSVIPSVTFANIHYITEASRPLPSNVIPVGGIHLPSSKPIPGDILEFIENSPHGVIYFTFGSVVSMSTLPDHIQKAFKEALAQVPQRVLWKYEGEMKDKPANVMTSKWFPQRDILLHPNVKLFISHGGISGVYEAVDAGVPVLGFPLFYDQPRNIENLVEAGMAISLDLLKVTKKPFLDAVTELINNKSYAENAKITSERFKDRPMTPAESVVYWTEYVIRHKGAPHLRSHALDLTWYQYFLLDVIAALLLALSIAGYVAYKVLKLIYSLASGQLLKNTKHKAE
ncbi:UDP-glucosyltransferase 2-like isoform X9 [Adelges cooleyi]|uniref:UDP-glucosyltransferase 2-like isoform X9 n=1 Tax=Adelges cooleyi TaxID=133065 RepID=UPI00217FB679|nr:UDP-glucosyltransferase 2-like isoform X9 [Adelges cooleyi]